jgi:hypothetical protein
MEVSALAERDKAFSERAKALCFSLGRFDRLVGEQCNREVGKKQTFVGRASSEAGTLCGLRHVLVLLLDASATAPAV